MPALLTSHTRTLSFLGAAIVALLFSTQLIFNWIYQHTGLPHPFIVLAILTGLVLLPICWQRFSLRALLREMTWPDWLMALFVPYVLLRLFLNPDSQWQDVRTITAGGVIYVLARVIGQWRPRAFLTSFIFFSYIILAITIFGVWSVAGISANDERVWIFDGILAAQWPSVSLGILAVVLFALALQSTSFVWSVLLVAVSGVICWFPLFVGARSILVMVFLCNLGFLVFFPCPFKKRILLFIMATIIVGMGLRFLPPARVVFFEQLQSTWSAVPPDSANLPGTCAISGDSIQTRKIMYRDAVAEFTSHPIFGVGAGEFGQFSCAYGFQVGHGKPHSTILHVAAELGLTGLAMFLGIVLWIVRRGFEILRVESRAVSIAVPLLGAWMFLLLYDQTSTSYFAAINYYLLTGLMVGALNNPRRSDENFGYHRRF